VGRSREITGLVAWIGDGTIVVALKPTFAATYYSRGLVYSKKGETDRAILSAHGRSSFSIRSVSRRTGPSYHLVR
jgi:hypothetical protein